MLVYFYMTVKHDIEAVGFAMMTGSTKIDMIVRIWRI